MSYDLVTELDVDGLTLPRRYSADKDGNETMTGDRLEEPSKKEWIDCFGQIANDREEYT